MVATFLSNKVMKNFTTEMIYVNFYSNKIELLYKNTMMITKNVVLDIYKPPYQHCSICLYAFLIKKVIQNFVIKTIKVNRFSGSNPDQSQVGCYSFSLPFLGVTYPQKSNFPGNTSITPVIHFVNQNLLGLTRVMGNGQGGA